MNPRRTFLKLVPVAAAPFFNAAWAQGAPPMVDEKEPQAVALGYVTDAKRADKAKFPKYVPPQHCGLCQFYQGAATAQTAPCTIFGGRRVARTGWCSAFVAKPG